MANATGTKGTFTTLSYGNKYDPRTYKQKLEYHYEISVQALIMDYASVVLNIELDTKETVSVDGYDYIIIKVQDEIFSKFDMGSNNATFKIRIQGDTIEIALEHRQGSSLDTLEYFPENEFTITVSYYRSLSPVIDRWAPPCTRMT